MDSRSGMLKRRGDGRQVLRIHKRQVCQWLRAIILHIAFHCETRGGFASIHTKDLFDGVNDVKDVPWEIKIVPGRGNGLYATRVLHRGDKILAGTPAGVYQSDAFFPDYPIGYKYLRKTYEHLPNATKEVFLRMATHTTGDMVMERINTNAFAGNFEGAPHFLLYPETAVGGLFRLQTPL